MISFKARLVLAAALIGHSAHCHSVAAEPEQSDVIGIWKSAVPPVGMKGEFANHDPIGLAAGARIKVDCSLNWTDPDTGKLYCFNSPTSFNSFLEWPKANIRRATRAFENLPTQ